MNPFATGNYRGMATVWLATKVSEWARGNALTRNSFFAYFFIERLRSYLNEQSTTADSPRATEFMKMFSYPIDWPLEKRAASNTQQYFWYIRAVHMAPERNGIRTAFFLPPTPAYKPLTEEERAVAGDLSYGPSYRMISDRLLELRKENVPIFSLLDLFADNHDTLYADTAHMKADSTGEQLGYRIMARTIARQVSDVWGLKADCAAGPFAPPVRLEWKQIDAKDFRTTATEQVETDNQNMRVVLQRGGPGISATILNPAPAGDWVTIELMLRVTSGQITATAIDERDGHAVDQQVIPETGAAGRMRLYFRSSGYPVTLRPEVPANFKCHGAHSDDALPRLPMNVSIRIGGTRFHR